MSVYYRPIARTDHARPEGAMPLAGGWCWFDTIEEIHRDAPGRLIPARDVPDAVLTTLTATRAAICGISSHTPSLMGILNVTPDSFSDGGLHFDPKQALAHAKTMEAAGAAIIDIGGESTRPGAAEVDIEDEVRRTAPVIAALRATTALPI